MQPDIQVLPADFDYAALDSETRIVVQQRASEIRTIARRTAADAIDIGQKLIEVKARLGHGQFGRWLEAEFAWQERTAQSFMAVAERFKNANIADLNFAPTALYMLAQPSVPDEARADALQRAESGERITVATAKAIVAEHATPAAPATEVALATAVAHMSDAAELKPAVRAWAMQIDPADPRGILQQMVITGSPVALRHFEQLGDALRAGGYRFMRSELQAAIRALIEELARPAPRAPRAVEYSPDEEPDRAAAAAPTTRAQCNVCGRPLSDPASIARGAGDTCSGKHDAGGNGHPLTPGRVVITAPLPTTWQRAAADLAAIVLDWLAAKVEALELAEDATRYCLEQIIKHRAGLSSAGGADAWRELRALKGWPAATTDEAKLNAVKAALNRLKGATERGDEDQLVTHPQPPASLNPAADPAHADCRARLDHQIEHVERFLEACRALRPWAQAHGDLIEDDAQLRRGFELLEAAYRRATAPA